jgi:biopolymer transport protein ExbD
MLMRRLFGMKRKGEDDEDAWEIPTSMIDVVFLLLIFFMCASKFRVLERRLDAFLPDRGSSPGPISDVEYVPIKVTTHSSSLSIPKFTLGKWVTHDPNALAARLKRLPRPGKYEIEIEGAQNCPFQHIMSAVDACARADLNKISFRPPLQSNRG